MENRVKTFSLAKITRFDLWNNGSAEFKKLKSWMAFYFHNFSVETTSSFLSGSFPYLSFIYFQFRDVLGHLKKEPFTS